MITGHRSAPTSGWRKSTFSNPTENCVEVAFANKSVWLRDSKDRGVGPMIAIPVDEWPTFRSIVVGEEKATPKASSSAADIRYQDNDTVIVKTTDGQTKLQFTPGEWNAFRRGIRAGQF